MEVEISLKALIRNKQGQYLILKRAKPYPGETDCRWDAPGGRLIPGELMPLALAREIKEETGMRMRSEPKVINVQDIMRVAGKHTIRIAFESEVEAEADKGIKLDPNEHSEYKWLDLDDALTTYHDMYLTPVLKKLKERS